MNDKNYKPHYKKHKFVPAFVLLLLWQSSNPSCSAAAAINEWHKGEMWQMVANETLLNKITKLHNEWNGIDICLTNNHLPNFCFISLTWSESETKLTKKCRITYPKLKLTNILKLKQHYSFTAILLHIPVCILVEKTITLQGVCVVDCWQ